MFIYLTTVRYTPIDGQDLTKPIPYNPSDPIAKQVLSSCQKSLENLGTTYLDSYILHSPLPTLEQTLEAWKTLGQLQDEGKVRLIGVSNTYDVRILASLGKARKVQVVQNRWYEGNEWDQKVFNYCKENGILYQWAFPLMNLPCLCLTCAHRSFWSLTGSPTLLAHPAVLELAKASNLTVAQTVYKFAQLQGIIPLSGTKNEEHMKQDVAVENLPLKGEGVEDLLKMVTEFIAA